MTPFRWVAPALLLLVAVMLPGCTPPVTPSAGNVLLLIADDLGIDYLAAYEIAPDAPATPHIDALAERGVLFRNAYAPPACSASRAALLTGRYPFRYGFGTRLEAHRDTWELPLSEYTLPELLAQASARYATGAVGKWHMSTFTSAHSLRHPLASGFDSHTGTLANLAVRDSRGERGSYNEWEKLSDGALTLSRTYATTASVDDTLQRMSELPAPWFLWVAFHAPHRPLHVPPQALSRHPTDTPADRFRASIEALDAEIGRLLAHVPENTTVIFLSDNGTPGDFARPPFEVGHAKGTLYEGGVRTPLLIAGPAVRTPGARSDALVHVVDVFATIAELAGADLRALRDATGAPVHIDGVSLLPVRREPATAKVRDFVFQGRSNQNGPGPRSREEWMVRDSTHKLTRHCAGASCEEALFRLVGVVEGPALPADSSVSDTAARRRLRAELDRILAGE